MTSLFENIEKFKNKIALIDLDNEKYYSITNLRYRSIIFVIEELGLGLFLVEDLFFDSELT